MPESYSEMRVRTHVVGIERLEKNRWRVSVDGRRLFTFCSESRARDAGRTSAPRTGRTPAVRPFAVRPFDDLRPRAPQPRAGHHHIRGTTTAPRAGALGSRTVRVRR